MDTILTRADLWRVAATHRLPPALEAVIADWMWALWRAVDGGDPDAFTLAGVGPIHLVTRGDSPDALPGGGQAPLCWCEIIAVDGASYYDAGLRLDTPVCHRLFGQVGALHPVVDASLARAAHPEKKGGPHHA